MHLVQLLLPLRDGSGAPCQRALFDDVRRELVERFGGVTAYARSPALGAWKEEDGDVARDDVVVYDVMVEELDRTWWAEYREELRLRFRQEELVVRASLCERL